ncbi:helix-turn-helix domain-containing protein [Fictibacillus sp. WQ 8-8]|uniref:XRE family transcriptional regulator n=1 Tax=Fictibacillus sp. WQ 8-8 TaxID=2938788 RepID=UPI00210917E6|nr:XRE family transcriptional regulator [Fictibacillus sp. WQ 8-8]MCQ6265598.1 helix-turn-helix domain-containing protein [Fictibacillus sp. WQ 8-8]
MKMIVINDLANAIRSKGYTQVQFAEKLGVDQPTVSRMCKQKRYTLERLQEVLEALGETDISKVIRVIEEK